jgi:hypothetical protein
MVAMPLLDHFHPPLLDVRHWTSFHHSWAVAIAEGLNERLPPGFVAEPHVQFGIEIDIAAFEQGKPAQGREPPPDAGGWSPAAPTQTLPLPLLTDRVEVQVRGPYGQLSLAGAIELVSPANKDRPDHRDAFVSKCAAYLQQGIGLVVIDVVTGRHANLHAALLNRLLTGAAPQVTTDLYAVAYRPVRRNGDSQFDTYEEELAVGRALPTMPLWLPGDMRVPVDLEATYLRTCHLLRIPPDGFAGSGPG